MTRVIFFIISRVGARDWATTFVCRLPGIGIVLVCCIDCFRLSADRSLNYIWSLRVIVDILIHRTSPRFFINTVVFGAMGSLIDDILGRCSGCSSAV